MAIIQEVLQRYLYFFREREKRRLRGKKADRVDVNDDQEEEDDDEDDENMVLADDNDNDAGEREKEAAVDENDVPDLTSTQSSTAPSREHQGASESGRRRFRRRSEEQKSVGRILSKLPLRYRARARKLLAHLCSVAVPGKISWDKRGVVSIGGRVLPGSSIVDLLNDTARKRKSVRAVARAQFAGLLRDVDTPPEFVGNQDFLDIEDEENFPPPRASSSPLPTVRREPAFKRAIDDVTEEEKTDGQRAVYVASERSADKTRVRGGLLRSASKRSVVDWNPLQLSVSDSSSARRRATLPLTKQRAKKREGEEIPRRVTPATFITSGRYKTRVSGDVSKTASKRRMINWNTLE